MVERESLRAAFAIPEEAVVFLYVGTLISRKGVDILENAWLSLSDSYSSAYLVIKTNIDDSPQFERLRYLSNITTRRLKLLTNNVDDETILSLYDISDVLVHPARAEGYGLTAAEALSRGLVVITTTPSASDDFLSAAYSILLPSQRRDCKTYPCVNNSYCVFPDMTLPKEKWTKWNHCLPLTGTPVWNEIAVEHLLSAMVGLLNTSTLNLWRTRARVGQESMCRNFNWNSIGAFFGHVLKERIQALRHADKPTPTARQ